MSFAIPTEWQAVLKQVRDVFSGAVIAGGALRDLMNDKPIKDVDIFVPVTYMHTGSLDAFYELIWDIFAGEDIELNPASAYGVKGKDDEEDRDLYAIFRLCKGNWSYDIILCSHRASKVQNFDINLCQIAYDGDEIITTRAYLDAIQTQTLKVMNINRTDRNAARLARLAEKYPEYTIIGETAVDETIS